MQPDDVVRIPIEDAIDLHAFAPRDVWPVVEDYLAAARDAGFTEVRLIHGRGKGVQRAGIQQRLGGHPLVEHYWDAPDHTSALRSFACAAARIPDPDRFFGTPASDLAISSSWPISSDSLKAETGTPEFTADATVR